jgi:hypothetical protein
MIIEVARIEGKIFETMKEAEAHGLELAARVGEQPYEIVFFFLAAAERLIGQVSQRSEQF